MDVQAEGVGFGVNLVRTSSVDELLKDVAWTYAPTFGSHSDERWWMVVGLQHVVGIYMGGKIGGDKLLVLTSGLCGIVSKLF